MNCDGHLLLDWALSVLIITMIILSFNWNKVFVFSHYFLQFEGLMDNKSLPMRFQFMPINLLSDVKRRSKSFSTICIQCMIKITTDPYFKLFHVLSSLSVPGSHRALRGFLYGDICGGFLYKRPKLA